MMVFMIMMIDRIDLAKKRNKATLHSNSSQTLQWNHVTTSYYDVRLWRCVCVQKRSLFHQGNHLISRIFYSRAKNISYIELREFTFWSWDQTNLECPMQGNWDNKSITKWKSTCSNTACSLLCCRQFVHLRLCNKFGSVFTVIQGEGAPRGGGQGIQGEGAPGKRALSCTLISFIFKKKIDHIIDCHCHLLVGALSEQFWICHWPWSTVHYEYIRINQICALVLVHGYLLIVHSCRVFGFVCISVVWWHFVMLIMTFCVNGSSSVNRFKVD